MNAPTLIPPGPLSTGVPAVPMIPTLFSSTTTSITLNTYVSATGLIGEGEELSLYLRITASQGDEISESLQQNKFPANISGVTVRTSVADLEPEVSYVFSIRAENRFGSSGFSGNSESISIPIEEGNVNMHANNIILVIIYVSTH